MRFPKVVPVLVSLLLATLACGGAPSPRETPSAGASPAPVSAPSTTAPSPIPRGRIVRRDPAVDLPDVTGHRLERAVRLLQAEGLVPYWSLRATGRPCRGPATVTRQRPREGKARFGSAVSLEVEVGRCPLTDDLRSVAGAFFEFARGGPPPPTTAPVLLLVGHEVVAVVPSARAGDRRLWQGCPASGRYSAALCPFDLLRPFERGPVRIDTAPPAHPCLHAGRLLPNGLLGLRSVTVTDEGSCPDHAAVRLFVDDADRVVAADLELPEP